MSTLGDFRDKLDRNLRLSSDLDAKIFAADSDKNAKIEEAIREYSKRRPRTKLQAGTGNGTGTLSLPSDWEEDFSRIFNFEYPIQRIPPEFVESKDFKVDYNADGLRLLFVNDTYPADGDTYWLRYAVRHTVDVTTSTVPVADEDALVNLACALACEMIALHFGNTSDPTLTADVVSYRTRGDEFAARAKDFRRMYDAQIKPMQTGFQAEWDVNAYEEAGYEQLLLKRPSLF